MIAIEREKLEQVLEALENGMKFVWTDPEREAGFVAIDAIKEALAQPEQYTDIVSDGGLDPRNKFDAQPEEEPVGFAVMERPWVGLTDEEINDAYRCAAEAINFCTPSHTLIVRAAEAKLKEKNNAA